MGAPPPFQLINRLIMPCQEFQNLPDPPFHIYFIANDEVFPKRIYIVTNVYYQDSQIMLHVQELAKGIPYEPLRVKVVEAFGVN